MATYTLSNFRKLEASSNEQLKSAQFADTDVLTLAEDIRVRLTNINKALAFCNDEKAKTAIILKTVEGKLLKVDAGIVSCNGTHINTTSGITIPLACVYSVDIY